MGDNKVRGFVYGGGVALELTPAEWRDRYPVPSFTRCTNKSHGGVPSGETWYRDSKGRLVAEVYGVIPGRRAK